MLVDDRAVAAEMLAQGAYRAARLAHWLKIKNPAAPAVKREMEEDWGTLGKRSR